MKVLLFLLAFLGLSFSLPAYLIQKEVSTSGVVKSVKKVKLYRTKGYEKEIWEQNGQKGESIKHFKKGRIVVYQKNPATGSYTRSDLPATMLLAGFMSTFACDQSGNCKALLEPTDKVRKIGKWKARLFTVKDNLLGKTINLWYTKDSKVLIEAEKLNLENLLSVVEGDPRVTVFLDSIKKEMNRIMNNFGAPVMIETSTSVGQHLERIESVKKVDLPENFFKVPKP